MRTTEIKIRVSEDEKELCIRESSRLGISLSEYIRARIVPTRDVPTKVVPTIVPTKVSKKVVKGFSSVHTEIKDTPIVHTGHKKFKSKVDEIEASGYEDVRETAVQVEAQMGKQIKYAMKMGDPEVWKATKEMVGSFGYKFDITTRTLKKGNIVIRRFDS